MKEGETFMNPEFSITDMSLKKTWQMLNSLNNVIQPCTTAGVSVDIFINVVNSNIPFLLSKAVVIKAKMYLNIENYCKDIEQKTSWNILHWVIVIFLLVWHLLEKSKYNQIFFLK